MEELPDDVMEFQPLEVVPADPIPEDERHPDTPFQLVLATLNRVAELAETPPPTDAQVKRHIAATNACRLLATKHGPEVAAQMYVWAVANWKGRVTWNALWESEPQVLRQMRTGYSSGKPTPQDHLNRIRKQRHG